MKAVGRGVNAGMLRSTQSLSTIKMRITDASDHFAGGFRLGKGAL
jgi:hypothetical protein